MTVQDIIDNTLKLLLEDNSFDGGIDDKTASIMQISALPRAYSKIVDLAPSTSLFASSTKAYTSPDENDVIGGKYGLSWKLPDDFIKLVSAKVSEWTLPLYIVTDNSKLGAQRGRYSRSDNTRPSMFIDGPFLRTYSGSSAASTCSIVYIPTIDFSVPTTTVVISGKVLPQLYYVAAGLTREILGDEKEGQLLISRGLDMAVQQQ